MKQQDYLITATNYRNLTARVIRARAVDTNDRVRFQETVDAIRGCGVEQAHLMGLMKEWKNAVGTAMGHAAAGESFYFHSAIGKASSSP